MAKLIGIAIKTVSRSPMLTIPSASISCDKGVADDFRGRPSKRQVTVLSLTAWQQACDLLGKTLPWTVRRANLLVDDLDLANSTGKLILIGDVKLEITQETDPCNRMEQSKKGLFNALNDNWRGGVCCRVIHAGEIKLNDLVMIE